MDPIIKNAFAYLLTRTALLAISLAGFIVTSVIGIFIIYTSIDPLYGLGCNVAVLPINGAITSLEEERGVGVVMADDTIQFIKDAEDLESIKGIMVVIDSNGGRPVASEMITSELRRAGKPVAAVIRESGMSGAYMIATGADRIFASPMSDVGSIGVTASYLEYTEQNKRDGIKYIELTSGEYKDTGSPDRALTPAERELLQRDIDTMHNEFVGIVARNRGIPIEDVQKIADGSSFLGSLALQNKLIDELGDEQSALDWLKTRIDEDAVACK